MNLFAEQNQKNRQRAEPLAYRMRPRSLEDFVGQNHFIGPGKLLRRMLESNRLTSAVFHGPPGCGKTTLAHITAEMTDAHFAPVNATSSGVKELRELLADAHRRLETEGRRTLLFVDELHRFNRGQQDVLLGDVESGAAILIGATTENPFFTVNTPLLSRSQIFRLNPLSLDETLELLKRALQDPERGLGSHPVNVSDAALKLLARTSNGDARRALNALEVAVMSQLDLTPRGQTVNIDESIAADSIQQKIIRYDRAGDEHYDTASALIKSIRGGDPDAAIYWLARMLEAGEDPRFIARRIVISAAEDIGNADPMGLVLAQSAADATAFIGLPECELPLAQATLYLACAQKSNASARAIGSARKDLRENPTVPVPIHLRDAHYPGAKRLGHGVGYQSPHDAKDGIIAQEYLGVDRTYYEPTDRGQEQKMARHLEAFKSLRSASNANARQSPQGTP